MTHRFLLSDLVVDAADAHPTAVAAACDEHRLTWGQLEGRVGRLAAALGQVGVGRGDRVGIYLQKSLESLVAVHGILRAGAAYVPIDPMAPPETIAAIIEDCGITTLVSHEPRRTGVDRVRPIAPAFNVIGLAAGPEESGSGFVTWDDVDGLDPVPPVSVLGDDLAYVMYTSGSTGKPKGIMHTHRSGRSYATMSAELHGLGPADRMANFSPLHFDMSTFEVLAGVVAGARVVLVPEQYLRFPASLSQYLADQGCTTLYTVPSLFQQLLSRGALADRDLSAVRWVLPAGEVFPPEPLKQLIEVFPNARFSNVYGPAEVNQCTYYHFSMAHFDADRDRGTLPIGYRCPDADLLVIDDDDRPITGPEPGQLLVRTATMMAGYWNRPDLNDRAFVERAGPGGKVERWYRTGDIVSSAGREVEPPVTPDPGQCLLYHGRQDNQVKIRGNRVELEMVEAAVASLGEVEQAVVGVRIQPGGDSELIARFVAKGPVASAAWRQHLAARLPAYAVPSGYEEVESFPLTPSGKIDRRTVRESIAGLPPC